MALKFTQGLKLGKASFQPTVKCAPIRHSFGKYVSPVCVNKAFDCKIGAIQVKSFTTKTTAVKPTKSIAPKFMFLGGNDLNYKVPPPQNDTSASVYLTAPPNDHEEDKEAAAYLGVNNFYRSGQSFYVLKFDGSKENMKLEDYVEMTKLDFYSRMPYGTVSQVYLNSTLTENMKELLQTNEVSCAALFFDKKGRPDTMQRPAEMILTIKTPGGFWNISCHSTFYGLASQKDVLFGNLLQNLRVELLNRAATTTVEKGDVDAQVTKEAATQPLIPKASTTAGPGKRLRKRIKPTITQQAPIGNLNINQTDTAAGGDDIEFYE